MVLYEKCGMGFMSNMNAWEKCYSKRLMSDVDVISVFHVQRLVSV
jgi:hypothetical protein